jgi:hypothetical protein
MTRKKLPIGIQTFREIRQEGYYYVDKTAFAQRLAAEGKTYFLSRPRRFGKSLLIDTLAEMFAANKALFEGLACYDTWDWETAYPVIRISFAGGIFSGLNNLKDITIDARFSAICGYTDEDVDTVFAPELNGLDRERIRHWYNGYNWTGTAVYNPFDLLLLFDTRLFRPYWFETGTPTFLVDTLTQHQYYLPRLQNIETSEGLLSSFEIGDLSPEALLFQTGYLTIAGVREVAENLRFALRFPNREVRASLTEALLRACSPNPVEAAMRADRLPDLLDAADFTGIKDLFTAHFAAIPHDWYRNNPIARYEGYYASVFYTFFASLGLDTIPEDTSSTGRLDLAVRYGGQVFLFEFKLTDHTPDSPPAPDPATPNSAPTDTAPTDTAPTNSALAQLKARGYADKYRADGIPIHLVGIEFSRATRNITTLTAETV